jgi:GDP-4-dehydro-6-deoxy-D-mannose reductase
MVRRAVITGASGRIGQALQQQLRSRGYELRLVDLLSSEANQRINLLSDVAGLEDLLRDFQPQVVFHAAALIKAADAASLYQANTGMLLTVIEALHRADQNTLLVNLSSASELGRIAAADSPVGEDYLCQPATAYGASKLCQTTIGLAAARYYGFRCVCPRIFNIVGLPGPGGSPLDDWLNQALQMKRGQQPLVLKTGDLSLVRDFIDLPETVRILADLGEHPEADGLINVGSGQGFEYRELVQRIRQISGLNFEVSEDPKAFAKGTPIPNVVADISKLRGLLGEAPAFDMDATISAYLAA